MWRIYGPNGHGVAIQSTIGRLRRALDSDAQAEVLPIRYVDFETHYPERTDPYGLFTFKRRAFEHEREVRAIIKLSANEPQGRLVARNLDVLIERVVVSPLVPTWYAEVVEAVTRSFTLNKPIARSSLYDEPKY
jgi:hypothetical protein